MPALTPAALRTQIASGSIGPLYVLTGDDDTEKAAVAAEFADTIDEGLRAFNMDRLYGTDADVDDLVQAAATFPMMAPRRLVLVLAAEHLLIPKRESKAAEQDQERLEAFIADPPGHATIVFVCGALDLRRRIVKQLLQAAQVVNCGTIGDDDADAERWVQARAAGMNVPLDGGAVRALVRRAGRDLVRLRSGLERLALYAWGQPTITADDVRQAVPTAPDAPADWGIANAIERNDAAEALHQLDAALEMLNMPPQNAAIFLLGQVRLAARKFHGARLRAGMDAVMRTDLALKSSGGDPRILLERLVVELCSSHTSHVTRLRSQHRERPDL